MQNKNKPNKFTQTSNLTRKQTWLFYHEGFGSELSLEPSKEEPQKKMPLDIEFNQELDNNF